MNINIKTKITILGQEVDENTARDIYQTLRMHFEKISVFDPLKLFIYSPRSARVELCSDTV